jgi:hypothetical protein
VIYIGNGRSHTPLGLLRSGLPFKFGKLTLHPFDLNPDRYDTNYFELFNWDDESEDLELHGDLHDFQRRSGQSVEFFVHWLRATNWFDIPAPGCNTLP